MEEKLIKYFQKIIPVDNKLHLLPPEITMVPTIISDTSPTPIVGKDTFKWVQQMKFLLNRKGGAHQNRISQNSFRSILRNTGPLPFISSEMSDGVSDTFAYKEKDDAVPHRYVSSNLRNQTVIFTAPEEGKIGKNEANKKIKEMEEAREKETASYTSIMKQQQLNALLNARN